MQIHKQTHATCAPHQHISPVSPCASGFWLCHTVCLCYLLGTRGKAESPSLPWHTSFSLSQKSRIYEHLSQGYVPPLLPHQRKSSGGMWPPSPCYRFSTVRVCVWDVLYTHQIITEKLWTPPFCIWCMFKTLHISQRLWVPAVQDCVYNRQSLTTCNIHNIYSTNHAENNTLH